MLLFEMVGRVFQVKILFACFSFLVRFVRTRARATCVNSKKLPLEQLENQTRTDKKAIHTLAHSIPSLQRYKFNLNGVACKRFIYIWLKGVKIMCWIFVKSHKHFFFGTRKCKHVCVCVEERERGREWKRKQNNVNETQRLENTATENKKYCVHSYYVARVDEYTVQSHITFEM